MSTPEVVEAQVLVSCLIKNLKEKYMFNFTSYYFPPLPQLLTHKIYRSPSAREHYNLTFYQNKGIENPEVSKEILMTFIWMEKLQK